VQRQVDGIGSRFLLAPVYFDDALGVSL